MTEPRLRGVNLGGWLSQSPLTTATQLGTFWQLAIGQK